jgi:hypothetical protein
MRVKFHTTVAFRTGFRFVKASVLTEAPQPPAQAELQDQLAALLQQQWQEFSTHRLAQIQDIRLRISLNEVEQMSTDLQMLFDLMGASTDPAKVQRPGVVEQN